MDMMEQLFCPVAGHRIGYRRSGHGEPVILVHGITTYSFIWRRIVPLLNSQYDVIALDLLGCGASDMPLDLSFSIKDHASYLHEFVTSLGIDRFHLVGHDLGGGISQIFSVRHPEMLIDLSLMNSVAYDFWPVQPITIMRTPIVRQLLMATLDKGLFKLIVQRGIYDQEKVTPELLDLFLEPYRTAAARKAFLHFARCLDNHNLTDIEADLRNLDLPVLILHGLKDPYLSAEIARKLHAEIPGSRLHFLEASSHFLQEDEPELIAERLLEFFQRGDDES
jgi:2-hydroxymuconate-semialdehyde hydrolase